MIRRSQSRRRWWKGTLEMNSRHEECKTRTNLVSEKKKARIRERKGSRQRYWMKIQGSEHREAKGYASELVLRAVESH